MTFLRARNTEKISISWRHHEIIVFYAAKTRRSPLFCIMCTDILLFDVFHWLKTNTFFCSYRYVSEVLRIISGSSERRRRMGNVWLWCESGESCLTHLPLDKMAAILADNFRCIFLNGNNRILIQISQKFVPMSPIGNKPALVQVMAWRRTGNKLLPESVLTQFTPGNPFAYLGRKRLPCGKYNVYLVMFADFFGGKCPFGRIYW